MKLDSQKLVALSFRIQDPRRIISEVLIATPINSNPSTGGWSASLISGERFTAIWDTGSTITAVVPRVMAKTHLHPHGFINHAGIDGINKRRSTVLASIAMSTSGGTTYYSTRMVLLERDDQLGGADVLIGMDIISRGDFAVSADEKGQLWCSFCCPHRLRPIRFESKAAMQQAETARRRRR